MELKIFENTEELDKEFINYPSTLLKDMEELKIVFPTILDKIKLLSFVNLNKNG